MSDSQPDKARQRPRFFTRTRIACFILAGLMAALLITLFVLSHMAHRVVEGEIAKIRAKGEPVTAADITPPPIPDEENAATLLERAFARMDVDGPAIEGWEDCLGRSFEAHRNEAENALELNAEAMKLARQALLRPRCQFDLDYSKGYGLELPHLTHILGLARLFAAKALVGVRTGRIDNAADSICHVFLLTHPMDDEPILVSKMVQLKVSIIGLDALKKVQALSPLPDEHCRKLIDHVRELDIKRAMVQAMLGERVIALDYIQRIIDGKATYPETSADDEAPSEGLGRTLCVRDLARVLRFHADLINTLRLPSWEARVVFFAGRDVEAVEKALEEHGPFSGLFLPSLACIPIRRAKGEARRDAAVIGLSCELYRSRHGRYPDNLDDLAPEFLDKLPPDPFTGKPFVYRRKGEGDAAGFIVYSVGPNLTDDGGVKKRSSDKDDIAWEGGATPKP